MGIGKQEDQVKIIDFGLAKKYRDDRTHVHIACRNNRPITGTTMYMSIHSHLGLDRSRRDDLKSVAYVLIYFLRGSLPWKDIKVMTTRRQRDSVLRKKMSFLADSTCPDEFFVFLKYARDLKFESKPNYTFLRQLFRDLSTREGYKYDYEFDWHMQNQPSSQ